jgi:anti-anti-sigma regulatory factor
VRGLSLPLIPVLDGVLVPPLIGAFHSARIAEFAQVLLDGIERSGARLVLLDMTGMPLIDQPAAAGLLRGMRAAALLGARCVLVGVRPEIAEELGALDAPLGAMHTAPTLQQALRSVLGPGTNPPET